MISDDLGALIIGLVFLGAFIIAAVQVVRASRREPGYARCALRRLADLVGGALLMVILIAIVVRLALDHFKGWGQVLAVEAGVAALVVAYYIIRWMRYPGLFESKSSVRITMDLTLASLVAAALPPLFLAHAIGVIPFATVIPRLGLAFKYRKFDRVKVVGNAPAEFGPGREGRIMSFSVISKDDPRRGPEIPVGSVYYGVGTAEGAVVAVPERYLELLGALTLDGGS
jgi:hypothetical protein